MGELDSPGCHCQQEKQSETHIVERCPKLAELRREVDELELAEWHTSLEKQEEEEKGRGGGEGER